MPVLLRNIPLADLEPGDELHHPELVRPTRVWWVLPAVTDAAARTLLIGPRRPGERATLMPLAAATGRVVISDRHRDVPEARLLAAARGAHWLTRHPQAGVTIDAGHVHHLLAGLALHLGLAHGRVYPLLTGLQHVDNPFTPEYRHRLAGRSPARHPSTDEARQGAVRPPRQLRRVPDPAPSTPAPAAPAPAAEPAGPRPDTG